MATQQQLDTVGGLIGRILVGLAMEKRIAVGFTDLPALSALKDIAPAEYRLVLASMLRDPNVKAALSLIEGMQHPEAGEKPVDAQVRP